LPALSRWLLFTLGALAVGLTWLQVAVVRGLFPPLIVLALPSLIVAVPILVTRWRWAPLLGALYWVLLTVINRRVIPYDITHPEAYNTFAFTAIMLGMTVVGAVAGVAATVQNYRGPAAEGDDGRRAVPGWFKTMVWTLAGICLGALLVGAIPRTSAASSSAGVSPETLAGLPALGMEQFKFDQQELRVKAGELVALRLDNGDEREHSFDIDELGVHVPIAIGQSGVALFTPEKPGSYTFYCAIPGHRGAGMAGTLIVEP
jgi:uncharacterized cupredoxin-like copper-binding protein